MGQHLTEGIMERYLHWLWLICILELKERDSFILHVFRQYF